jgi:hypothetical protein
MMGVIGDEPPGGFTRAPGHLAFFKHGGYTLV